MEKTIYEEPCTKVLEVRIQGTILQGSVEKMRTVSGSWDEDE